MVCIYSFECLGSTSDRYIFELVNSDFNRKILFSIALYLQALPMKSLYYLSSLNSFLLIYCVNYGIVEISKH